MAEPGAVGEAAALSVNSQDDATAAYEGATITEGVTNSDNNHKNPLQTLPAELVAEIVSHGVGSLHAFRLTCRALRDGSHDRWIARYTNPLCVRPMSGDIQCTVSVLAPSGCLKKVKAVRFIHLNGAEHYAAQNAGMFSEEQEPAFCRLLRSFLRVLPKLESVKIYDHAGQDLDGFSPGRAPLLLHALTEIRPSELSIVKLSHADYPALDLRSFLQAYENGMRSLKMMTVRFSDDDLYSVLAFIRDHLTLDVLHLSGMSPHVWRGADRMLESHFGTRGREHKWFRSKLEGKLEHYSIGSGLVEARGKGAIKLALNRVLHLEGNDLYDASMNKEALGL